MLIIKYGTKQKSHLKRASWVGWQYRVQKIGRKCQPLLLYSKSHIDFLKVEFPVLLSMMILFIQHNSSNAVPFKNSSVQYWLATFNTVCDLLEVTKSTVPMCGCMLVVLSDIYCQSTCCLFKLAEYSSNCSSFVSMVFPSFCRTYKQHNHTEKTNYWSIISDTILGRGTKVVTVWPQKYDSPIGSTFTLEISVAAIVLCDDEERAL